MGRLVVRRPLEFLPAHRDVNQNQKRDKLPGAEILRSAQQRIEEWWDRGYVKADNRSLNKRFMTEARATLPIVETKPRLDDVFAAVNMQQLRLKNDQQVPVWSRRRGGLIACRRSIRQ